MDGQKSKIYHFIVQNSYIYKLMKILQAIALLLIISTATAEPLQLFSASTLVDSVSGSLTGSLLGGRTIYIKGIGFPADPSMLQVFIGPFPCKIPADGVTQTTLSCQTTTSGGMTNIYNQQINVIYNEQIYLVPGALYSYVDSDTPWLTDIYPSTSPANTILGYIGRHRVVNTGDGIRNMGDFIGLYDGTQLCGMFDIVQGQITYNGINRVKCLQAREQQAGKYNVSEHVTAGWAYKQWNMRKPSLQKQYYEQTVLPAISSFTPAQGVVSGQDLVITGTGFSKDKTKVSVSVDGVNCAVTASTLTQVNCRLAAKQLTDTAMLNSDASTPVNNYIAGSGFSYTKFDLTNLVDKSFNGFKNALASNPGQLTQIQSGITYELEYQETQGLANYGQVFRGYFYAPVTGNYIFRGAADDCFSLRISPQFGTTGASLTELIFDTSATWSGQFYYITNHTSALGQPRFLQGGKYYYMEVLHVNWVGYGFFKISVQVPNTDATLPRKRYQVNQIDLSFTNDPQIMKFTLNSASGGTFNLSIYRVDPSTLQVTYSKQVTLKYNATAAEFGAAMNQFDLYSSYWTTCTQVVAYDNSGVTVATNSPTATKFQWTVSVGKLRADSLLSQKFTAKLNTIIASPGSSASFTQTRTKTHCPLINGTFTLTVGGFSVKIYDPVSRSYSISNIPSNVNSWDLAAGLKQINGFDKIDVYRNGDPLYGATWIISYLEYSGNVPDLVLSSSMLTGGAPGTNPQIGFFQTRPYSTNIIFNPVDENFMFQSANSSNVIVTVNSLKSVCLNSCSYTFLPNTPFVTAQSLSGSIVQITLSNPQNLPYGTDMIYVDIQGRQCQILPGGTFTSFTCQLDTNPNGQPILYAGDYNVDVVVQGLGVVPILNGVNPIHYPLTITSTSPTNGGTNGGYLVTIDGTGFPDNIQQVNLIVCDVSPTIISTSNTQTVFIAPDCPSAGQYNITYTYNSQTATSLFTYATPSVAATLLSIYPKSASPVLKAVMTITGTNFGNNISAITIYLANSTGKIYQMRVLSVNDTVITCGIPGGLPGNFDVKVAIDGQGDIVPADPAVDDFVYQLVVTSVTPTNVAYYGGNLITITGKNFSPDKLQNLVGIGNQLNWLCDIESLTTTQIKCRVPPTHPDWGNMTTQGITVTNRLIQDSVCPTNSCDITYSDLASSPSLTSSSLTSISGVGSITLYGTNFNLVPANAVQVVIKNTINSVKTIVTATTVQAGSVVFSMPALQAGFYEVKVRMDPIGETNSISINVTTTISSSTSNVSVKGGKLTINGQGLPSQWPSKLFTIKMQTNTFYYDVTVLTSTPTKLQLSIPAGINSQVHTVTLTNPLQQKSTLTVTQLQSSTPSLSLSLPSASPLTPGSYTIQLIRQTPFTALTPSSISLYQVNTPNQSTALNGWTYNGNAIVISNVNVKSGKYGLNVYFDGYGYADINGFIQVGVTGVYTASNIQVSYAGSALTVTGTDINPSALLRVGGFTGKVLSQSGSSTVFQIPPLITPLTVSSYPQLTSIQKIVPSSILSDNPISQGYSFDGKHSTYYSSPNTTCYIGLDIGISRLMSISRIRYFPYYKWVIASQYLLGAVFQASVDGVNYVQVGTVDQTVHAGWNSILINNNGNNYRYVRMRHDNSSGCKLSEFQVYGVVYNDVVMTSVATGYNANAKVWDGKNQIDLGPIIQYRQSATPVISTVTPATGTIYGNEVITLTGQNLNIGAGSILIDQIQCLINSAVTTSTHLQCSTQPRLTLPSSNSFNVQIGLNKAVQKQQFMYVMRWSDVRTWGTDLPPIQGDLVYVPQGMTLLVDQTTPRLDGIVVQNGRILFADQSDMEIHTNLITLNGGEFIAGTEKKPYQHKLTFIMYGSYYGKQQPMFGNKGIGCMNCKFSMYGTPRTKTWTVISNTINPGDTIFTVQDTVDWQVGQDIVVASTSFDHNEAEQRTISAVSGNTITVSQPFNNKHLGVVETYGSSDRLQIKAEVGLLTRNIKMMGDPTSEAGQYGSHLMLTGNADSGLVGKVAYTEFTHCGQPRIVGRYCMHFHMAGDVVDSYAKGNAVHHSFARVITIHGVHYLQISDNVGYRVKGHNFFIEDGIETQNVIENNLAIGSLESWNMMQTDISVASFWVTNPTNHLRNNRAAGGDFYGFWYEIKPHPDGPSATEDVCPIGNPLGESHDNVAHSYKRFGLRIFKLYSRQSPCDPIRDDTLADPWSTNPSIQSRFYNYLLYKCGQSGLLAERTGNTIFQNFTLADNKRSGMQFYFTNFTKQLVQARNFAVIGLSRNNAENITTMNNAAGIIAPRTSGWAMSNARFYNFASYMNIFQTCSHCENPLLFTNTAHQYMVSGVTYTNVTGSYLKMAGFKRQIIYDTDASFSRPFNSNARTSATVVYSFPHIAQQPGCSPASTPALWDNTVVCDQSTTIRSVMFTNLQSATLFQKTPMKIQLLTDVYDVVASNSTAFTQIFSVDNGGMEPMSEDQKFSYSIAFVAGRVYNIWWLTGLDFTHVNVDVSKKFVDSDPAIIFKFNYTQYREYFELGQLVNGRISGNLTSVTINSTLDQNLCSLGDYTHDVDNRTLTLCATNRGKQRTYEYLDVVGVRCKYLCPAPPGQYIKQNFIRLWSNVTQWPGGILPQNGDDVTIQGQWTILMDVQPNTIGYLLVKGDLIIPDNMLSVHIVANNIWIQTGTIKAGSSSTPYPGQLTIQIIGNKNDVGIVIDPLTAGNKMFVVTGKLELYGQTPATAWTKLQNFARPGDTSILVGSTAGWAVGDEIGIAPSFSTIRQEQRVTITAINGNNVTFTPPLNFKHYGDTVPTVVNTVGTLDTRAGVAHFTRKIKIISGADEGWGFHLLIYGYLYNNTILRTGSAILQGVEMRLGGQYDTENSAVKILNTVGPDPITIYRSSFVYCRSYCLDIENINNAIIRENVFFEGRRFLTRALKLNNYIFENNLMIAAIKRPTLNMDELVACYATYDAIHLTVSSIRGNLCQGSDKHGIILPFVPCSMVDNPPYSDNTAGSAMIGFAFNRIPGEACLAGSGAKVYACQVGHIAGSPATAQIIFQKFMSADSNRGVTLRFGRDADDNTAYFRNSYVSAISRPNCVECYGANGISCNGGRGVRMLAVTINGETFPMTFGMDFDIICRRQSFDAKAFLNDIIFQNFRQSYPTLPQCSNNVVFEPHRLASDMTGSHHLYNTVCNNCQTTALARFTPTLASHLGWFGGCGRIPCTGKSNYLVSDWTGDFLGQPGFLLANNTQIGNKTQNCKQIPEINGHICKRLDYGVIQYESIAPDYNTRIMWPVYLQYDGGLWNTTTNGWREWDWQGNEPLNHRLARFVSVVQVNKVYNMTFQSQPPIDMRFQFQRRYLNGNNSQYIVVKLYYPRPNSIRVEVGGNVVKPISLLDNNGQSPLRTSICGSNKFFYQNYTIHFVITADIGCQVRVSLTNSIQLTARFSMDINNFFAVDGQTKFIDRMCAVLGIVDTSRLKIVGIYNGSVTIVAYIDQAMNTTVDNATSNDNDAQKQSIAYLSSVLLDLYQSGNITAELTDAGLGPLISLQSQTYYHKYDPDVTPQDQLTQQQQKKLALYISVSVAAVSLVFALVAGIIYYKKKGLGIVDAQAGQVTQVKMEETIVDQAMSYDH